MAFPKHAVIVTAAGSSERFNASKDLGVKKEYLAIDGHTILYRAIAPFLQVPNCAAILVTYPEGMEDQCAVALENLAKIHAVVGDRIAAAFVTGTDFGYQAGPFIAPAAYRDLYKPFHTEVNAWIHRRTKWKSFIHTCGSVAAFIPDFIEAGFDILNPVQCSAAHMDPAELKRAYGGRLAFWGGAVDTQRTLPYGTPDEVRAQVRGRVEIFAPGGGFVFNAVHNIQAKTPVANVQAFFEAAHEFGRYAP